VCLFWPWNEGGGFQADKVEQQFSRSMTSKKQTSTFSRFLGPAGYTDRSKKMYSLFDSKYL
jgi:hypothetical protein